MARSYRYARRSLRKRSASRKQTTTSFPVLPLFFGVLALAVIAWMLMHPR